jgi:hypothetical protein
MDSMNFRSSGPFQVVKPKLTTALLLGGVLLCCASSGEAQEWPDGTKPGTQMRSGATSQHHEKRPVTVADSIEMTRLADSSYTSGGLSKGIVGKFSPNGEYFAVVLRRGNLQRNTNEYSVRVFRTAALSSPPRVLVSVASGSNRPTIKDVTWLGDNDTILFLGEQDGEHGQIYSVRRSTGVIRRLTSHLTNVTSFTSTANGDCIVYSAESPVSTFATATSERRGIHVALDASVSDLIRGQPSQEFADQKLFIKKRDRKGQVTARIEGSLAFADAKIFLSPNGKFFAVQTEARDVPARWREYNDKFLQVLLAGSGPLNGRIPVYQYELVDTEMGNSRILIDAPIRPNWGSEVAWASNSASVLVSDMYLPLAGVSQAEQESRKSKTFLVEIKVPSRDIVKVSDQDLRLIAWDRKNNSVVCELGKLDSLNGRPVPKVYFRKKAEVWSQLESPPATDETVPRLSIVLDENLNEPPRIVAVDIASGRRTLLVDLNPQFDHHTFTKVEPVTWRSGLGSEIKGGLYWPLGYVAGERYPVVIQTHGFTPDRFWIDGPFTTAFAAQALAAKGFFVLQVPDPDWHLWDTPDEAPRAQAAYEGAIEYLDHRGLIDPRRVGIIGFSRTCFHVAYTLTHSRYDFVAAVIADGADASYFQYMVLANAYPTVANEFEAINGAAPFGDGLSLWMKNSPEFLMKKVRAALMIQAIGPASLLGQWGWFSGMSRLGKPVDMIYIPDGVHILEKPWERVTSQQGTVDWFCFWLKGEEDSDPSKTQQYVRWRELRKLRDDSQGSLSKK